MIDSCIYTAVWLSFKIRHLELKHIYICIYFNHGHSFILCGPVQDGPRTGTGSPLLSAGPSPAAPAGAWRAGRAAGGSAARSHIAVTSGGGPAAVAEAEP